MTSITSRLPQSIRHFSGRPVVKRTVIGLITFIVLLGLFGFFALPGIIKSQAEQRISEKLNRQTTIGKVEVNPYTMRVQIRDMKATRYSPPLMPSPSICPSSLCCASRPSSSNSR